MNQLALCFRCSSLQIREEIDQYCIKVYQFPDCDSDEDEDFKQQDHELKVCSAAVAITTRQERVHHLFITLSDVSCDSQ